MTPYHKLPHWWELCDAIRKDMDDAGPRLVLADYVDENGHNDLANGIRAAWREGYKYFDEYVYSTALGRDERIRVDYDRGFIDCVRGSGINAARNLLNQLVRSNIVLSVSVNKHAYEVDGRYYWDFRSPTDHGLLPRGESPNVPINHCLSRELKDYIHFEHDSDREANIALYRGLISYAIDTNCDGTEGKFMSRENGANIIGRKLEKLPPAMRQAVMEATAGRNYGVASTTLRLPSSLSQPPTVASESPSVDPS